MANSNDIGRQLERHRNETIQAIKAGRTDIVTRRLNAYAHFIQVVIYSLHDLNIKYTPVQASKITALDWPILRYLEWNLYKIIESIFATTQIELASESIRLLIKILKLSCASTDYLIFKRTLDFFPALLRIAFENSNTDFQQSVVENLRVNLIEFADNDLIFPFSDLKLGHKRDQYLVYLQYVLETIQAMLKQSVDSRSLETFIDLGNAFDELVENISIEFYRRNPNDISLSPMDFHKSAWFDLGSWLCNLYKEPIIKHLDTRLTEPSETGEIILIKMINQVANRFNSFAELSQTYVDKSEFDPFASRLGDWILDSMPRGKMSFIDTSSPINLFFCVRALSLLPVDIGSTQISITPNSIFKSNLENIVNTSKDIEKYRYYWEKVIPPESLEINRIEYFISLIKNAVSRFERENEDRIITSSINANLVEQFRKDVIESWQESAWLRKLTSSFSTIQQRESNGSIVEYLGINAAFPKEAFIDAPEMQYIGIGKEQGRSLGSSESSKILKDWFQNSMIESIQGKYSESIALFENAIQTLKNRGYTASAIIILDNYSIVSFLIKHGELIYAGIPNFHQKGISFHEGFFRYVPVFWKFDNSVKSALILDLNAFGIWVDYIVSEISPKTLLIKVEDMNEELIRKRLEQHPEDNRHRLLQRVHVTIGERFDYEIRNPNAAIKILFNIE